MGSSEQPKMERLLVELQHPLRRELLRLTIGSEPISPTELSRQVKANATLSTVAYHVRVLANCGALELVETQLSRGSTMHFYRAAGSPERAREALRLAEAEDGTEKEIS